MLRRNIFVLEAVRLFKRALQHLLSGRPCLLGKTLHLGQRPISLSSLGITLRCGSQPREKRRHHPSAGDQCRKQVHGFDLLILVACSNFLRARYSLRAYRHFFKSQHTYLVVLPTVRKRASPRPALNLPLHPDALPELPAGGRCGHGRRSDMDSDLFWLGFFLLRNAQRKHAFW